MKIQKKYTKDLTKTQIKNILKLKNKHWKYGLKAQREWYKKFVKKNDINVIGIFKRNIVAYTLLRKRTLVINNQKKKYFYLDTFISDKGSINALMLMKYLKAIIKKKICILVCKKKHIKFYSFFGFRRVKKTNIKVFDKVFKIKNYLCLNIKNNNSKIDLYLNK
jgi:hypothetical protein